MYEIRRPTGQNFFCSLSPSCGGGGGAAAGGGPFKVHVQLCAVSLSILQLFYLNHIVGQVFYTVLVRTALK